MIDVETADELLTTTRAVRRRMDFERPVEREVIERCVEIALQAPVGSAFDRQHFVVITDARCKRRLADVYRKACYPYLDAADAQAAALDDADPIKATRLVNLSLARWQADTLHEVPALVVAAKEGRVEGKDALSLASFYGSILPGAWSFMLALRARGIGACWTTLHLAHEDEAGQILGMPGDVTQAALLSVGYYKGETFRPAGRQPLESQIHWDRW